MTSLQGNIYKLKNETMPHTYQITMLIHAQKLQSIYLFTNLKYTLPNNQIIYTVNQLQNFIYLQILKETPTTKTHAIKSKKIMKRKQRKIKRRKMNTKNEHIILYKPMPDNENKSMLIFKQPLTCTRILARTSKLKLPNFVQVVTRQNTKTRNTNKSLKLILIITSKSFEHNIKKGKFYLRLPCPFSANLIITCSLPLVRNSIAVIASCELLQYCKDSNRPRPGQQQQHRVEHHHRLDPQHLHCLHVTHVHLLGELR